MNRATALSALTFTAFFTLAGCGNPSQPEDSTSYDGADEDAKADTAASFTTCKVDSDCVAIPTSGCCPNADKIALAKSQLNLWEQTHQNRMVCNEQILCTAAVDNRVAECSNTTHHCKMVQPQNVRCGGFVRNPHSCPKGWECDFPGVPDVPGYCIESAPQSCVDNVFCKLGSHWDSKACKCVDNAPNPNDACGGCAAGTYCTGCWGHMACIPVGALC
jgi:hypothetical protein